MRACVLCTFVYKFYLYTFIRLLLPLGNQILGSSSTDYVYLADVLRMHAGAGYVVAVYACSTWLDPKLVSDSACDKQRGNGAHQDNENLHCCSPLVVCS